MKLYNKGKGEMNTKGRTFPVAGKSGKGLGKEVDKY